MGGKIYRAWLRIEEVNHSETFESKLVEQVELATFQTIEEALRYRHELSQKYSPRATGEAEPLDQLTSPGTFKTGV
jgi:hypothetical protein